MSVARASTGAVVTALQEEGKPQDASLRVLRPAGLSAHAGGSGPCARGVSEGPDLCSLGCDPVSFFQNWQPRPGRGPSAPPGTFLRVSWLQRVG